MKDKRLWINYCRSLGVNPDSSATKESDYYRKGFAEWKRLKDSFSYYNYMSYSV